MDVEALNRSASQALLTDGEVVPISNWFDGDGEECEPEDATYAVVGPTAGGKWISVDLSAFEIATIQ